MKRFLSVLICVLIIMCSFGVFSVSAEQITDTNCIYFQVPNNDSVSWKNFSMIFCHIWREGNEGGDFFAWQSKFERCTDLGNGYWSYDLSGLEFDQDATYCVIFSNENGMQTYNLTLTSACMGDIVICDGDMCVNPVDSSKQCAVARWMQNGEQVHPCVAIDSTGAIVDPDNISGQDIDLAFGDGQGVSVEMPEVEVPTEATEPETEENTDNKDSNLIWYLVFGGALLIVVAVVVVLIIVKSKSKKNG